MAVRQTCTEPGRYSGGEIKRDKEDREMQRRQGSGAGRDECTGRKGYGFSNGFLNKANENVQEATESEKKDTDRKEEETGKSVRQDADETGAAEHAAAGEPGSPVQGADDEKAQNAGDRRWLKRMAAESCIIR